MADTKLLAKGGLIILVIVSLAVLIERLTSSSRSEDSVADISNRGFLIDTTISPTDDDVDSIYSKIFARCLGEHSKSYYYPINAAENVSLSCLPPGRCLHNLLIDASKHLESLGIKLQLIEPSLLFCLLTSARKFNLITRGFSSSEVRGLKNVLTFGLSHSEAKILDDANTRKRLISLGYRIQRFQRAINPHIIDGNASEVVSDYFLIWQDMVLHLLVFYPRGTYLFSPSFVTSEISLKGLLYIDDRAFEKFNTSTAYLNTLSTASVLLPSDARCFLLDMMSSEFQECKAISSDFKQNVNTEVLMALKELKAVLASQMVSFWLWSKSLQGWFEECDILHYPGTLQFSISAKSVEGFNFSALFANSECQYTDSFSTVTNNIRNVELNCYGIPIHLIFMYEEKVTYWCEHLDNGNTYKLRFPKFTLCSTDVYGEKINIPCETSEILESEYGQFLKNTTLHLDPGSMKNVLLMERA